MEKPIRATVTQNAIEHDMPRHKIAIHKEKCTLYCSKRAVHCHSNRTSKVWSSSTGKQPLNTSLHLSVRGNRVSNSQPASQQASPGATPSASVAILHAKSIQRTEDLQH